MYTRNSHHTTTNHKVTTVRAFPMGPKATSAISSYPQTWVPGFSCSQYLLAANSWKPTVMDTTIIRKKMIDAGISPPYTHTKSRSRD